MNHPGRSAISARKGRRAGSCTVKRPERRGIASDNCCRLKYRSGTIACIAGKSSVTAADTTRGVFQRVFSGERLEFLMRFVGAVQGHVHPTGVRSIGCGLGVQAFESLQIIFFHIEMLGLIEQSPHILVDLERTR